jgi:hypothetical protein
VNVLEGSPCLACGHTFSSSWKAQSKSTLFSFFLSWSFSLKNDDDGVFCFNCVVPIAFSDGVCLYALKKTLIFPTCRIR